MLHETIRRKYSVEEILVLNMPRFFSLENNYARRLPTLSLACPDLARWIVELCCGLFCDAEQCDIYSNKSEFPEEIFCTIHDEAFNCANASSLNAIANSAIEREIYSTAFYDIVIEMIIEVLTNVYFLKGEDCVVFAADGIFPILREPNIYLRVHRKPTHFQ